MQKYIGRQLKTARLNKKLTQEQIAEAVGLSAKHYGCIERGEVSTTVAVLTRLQQVLEFEVSIMIKKIVCFGRLFFFDVFAWLRVKYAHALAPQRKCRGA